MLKEEEYTFDGVTYCIKQLSVPKAQEVLVKLLRFMDGDGEMNLASIPAKVTSQDIDFLRDRLLGENCSFQNEAGNWVPLGRAVTDSHFAGRLGKMFHILGKCLVVNFSDFLDDLGLEGLTGTTAE